MSTPSLRSIAEAAGVSVSSVSNAYNRPDRLSAPVRERILAVAEELGYAGPNPAARALRTNRVGAVGVLLTTPVSYAFSDPYCLELLRGVSEVTDRARTALELIPLAPQPGTAGQSAVDTINLDAVRRAVVDGAITDGLADDHPAARVLAARGIPLVRSTDSDVDRCVIIDDFAAGRTIGKHLAEQGHRDVVVVVGTAEQPGALQPAVDEGSLYAYSRRRLAGIRDGLGPGAQVDVVGVGGNTAEAGRAAAELVLDRPHRPSAIAADSDVLAAGVISAATGHGLRVGDDLAVTGFDDLPVAEEVGLTTVRQPIREKGRLLARLLLDPDFTQRRTVLDTVLVPRASTAGSAPHRDPAGGRGQRRPILGLPARPVDDQEWRSGDLDLQSYLHRIGYEGDLTPDGQTLRLLHRAHTATIPFENLDVILGRGVRVELTDIQTKLVYRRRGGYCYEQNLLFAAALDRLGYRVQRLLARTGDPIEQPRPHSHLVLSVQSGDHRWLADVGFGSGLLEPMPLTQTQAVRQGAWSYRLLPGDDGAWRLRELRGHTWETLYTFTEEPQFQVDMEMANHNTSTHPNSPFVQRPILVRKTDTQTQQLIGRRFTVSEPDRTVRQADVTDDQYRDLLRGTFQLSLADGELSTLIAALPPEPTNHD